jgi:hypothetical protein
MNDMKVMRLLAQLVSSAFVLTVFMVLAVPSRSQAADIGLTFSTPKEAVDALVKAAGNLDREGMRALFGLATDELVASDQVQMTNEIVGFLAAYSQTNRLVRQSAAKYVLEVGHSLWTFPIPLVNQNNRWHFDTDAGKEELINRRIGRNELTTIQALRAYVEAQREYAMRDRDGDEVLEFAQKIRSTPGAKDGLYWPPNLDGEMSPLGPFAARAQSEGYQDRTRSEDAAPQPFNGYYFKILTRQGAAAPGGAFNYIVNGNMIGGFALVAWPADYGESGIMTFIINQQGRVYQQDLGPKTARKAALLKSYNPDANWTLSPD